MKDFKGHGSNGRGKNFKPLPGHDFHRKTDAELRYIAKDAGEAGKNAQEMGDERGVNKYADQVNDAASVLGYRGRTGAGPDNADAARTMAQGHDKSGTVGVAYGHGALPAGGRHGYNPSAVSDAIAGSKQKIGGREAKMIHALLKGRG